MQKQQKAAAAVEEIRKTFEGYQQSIDRTLDANANRMKSRTDMDQNFSRIVSILDHNIKPLIRDQQSDADQCHEKNGKPLKIACFAHCNNKSLSVR